MMSAARRGRLAQREADHLGPVAGGAEGGVEVPVLAKPGSKAKETRPQSSSANTPGPCSGGPAWRGRPRGAGGDPPALLGDEDLARAAGHEPHLGEPGGGLAGASVGGQAGQLDRAEGEAGGGRRRRRGERCRRSRADRRVDPRGGVGAGPGGVGARAGRCGRRRAAWRGSGRRGAASAPVRHRRLRCHRRLPAAPPALPAPEPAGGAGRRAGRGGRVASSAGGGAAARAGPAARTGPGSGPGAGVGASVGSAAREVPGRPGRCTGPTENHQQSSASSIPPANGTAATGRFYHESGT